MMSAIDLLCCLPVSDFYYYLFKVVGLFGVQIKSATIIQLTLIVVQIRSATMSVVLELDHGIYFSPLLSLF